MITGHEPIAMEPGSSGITRLTTQHDSILLVDWGLRAYQRMPGPLGRLLPGDQQWLRFTDMGPVEIGRRVTVLSASQIAGRYVSSPIVTIEPVRPPRELSAAEIETVRFVGGYINYGLIPRIRLEL